MSDEVGNTFSEEDEQERRRSAWFGQLFAAYPKERRNP
jgi:hypothetical protein